MAYQLPSRAKNILIAMSRALVSEPDDLVISHKEKALIFRCEQILSEFHFLFRLGFVFGVYVFDLCAVFFGIGFKRFVHRALDKQERYLDYCLCSRVAVVRNLVVGMRGLIMICYFSHPDVWSYIGYDPKTHVAEKMALRKRLRGCGE